MGSAAMADNQGVTESWRPARRANVIDPQVKRMGLVAAGVAAVLALGVGGYTLVSRRPARHPGDRGR